MELYTRTSYEIASHLTRRYSTSFSLSSRLFAGSIRPHIYAIYGLVRIADEIVDSYRGHDAAHYLDMLEAETYQAIRVQYSPNPIVHAFASTARYCAITDELIAPFFASMRMDVAPQVYTAAEYQKYIYGSAEVVGLMCLRVSVPDTVQSAALSEGARALGAAYQKINFLRDIANDYQELGRSYFPSVTSAHLTHTQKDQIITDIMGDFSRAADSINALPWSSRRAVRASQYYYGALLGKLARASPDQLLQSRIRVSPIEKLALLLRAAVGL